MAEKAYPSHMRRRFQIAITGHMREGRDAARGARALPGKAPGLLATLGMLLGVAGALAAVMLFGSLLAAGLWVFFVLVATVALVKAVVRGLRRG
jgi:Flp pilus assembly protein TadB